MQTLKIGRITVLIFPNFSQGGNIGNVGNIEIKFSALKNFFMKVMQWTH